MLFAGYYLAKRLPKKSDYRLWQISEVAGSSLDVVLYDGTKFFSILNLLLQADSFSRKARK